MNDEIKEILDNIKRQNEWDGIEYFKTPLSTKDANKLLDYITNLQKEVRVNNDLIPHFKNRVKELKKEITNLQQEVQKKEAMYDSLAVDYRLAQEENERLNKEVAKLHIIQEEYGSHIENTHIIDDYQKTYFMTNKWLIELKDGRFVDINVLNSYYEDYKSRCENAYEELTYMSSSDYVEDYDIKQNCWIKLSNILQNGSDNE